MTVHGAQIAGSAAARDVVGDWQAVRGAGDIQFAPLPPLKAPETPGWLERLSKFLEGLLGPVGELFGMSWPVLEKLLIALAVLLALFVLWRLLVPVLEAWRLRRSAEEEEWRPDRQAAAALLEDADRLAAEGRFGEAAHLLLQRSVHHIGEARPDWLLPASTAREISTLPMLAPGARAAFTIIATRVERSLFALRVLDREDWEAARAAYADFALAELAA